MAGIKEESVDWKKISKASNTVPENLKFAENDELFITEIGDGNLNDVVRVYTTSNDGQIDRSIIIKRSMPYIKCLGPQYPLGVERIHVEYKALTLFHSVSPGSVPQPFFLDTNNNALGMEDLQGYEQFRSVLMRGEVDLEVVRSVAAHLGTVHHETHIATIGQQRLQQLDTHLENSNMCTLTEQYVFTRPFTKGDLTNRCCAEVGEVSGLVYSDAAVLGRAAAMLQLFRDKKECVLHGDLHTESVLVAGQQARIIDLEFACVGPAAFDLGMLLANYIFSYYRHMSMLENNDKGRQIAQKLIEACHLTVSTYLGSMRASVGPREAYVSNFMSQVAGFAGCELIRRLLGAAHVRDLEGLGEAQRDCLGAGVRLLQGTDNIHNIDRLMLVALMLA